jgi:hypothetical protein
LLVAQLARRPRDLARVVLWAAASAVPLLAIAGAYSHARWGNPLATGYEAVAVSATENVLLAAYGFFFSLGKGLFIFSPPLVPAVLGWPRFARRSVLVALAATALPVLYVYCRYTFWGGDYAWGPRYIIFVIPAALLPLVPLLDRLWASRRRLAQAGVALALAAGVAVQVLGGSFYWDTFIRVSIQAKTAWLGPSNRSGARIATQGDVCGACFEDTHAHTWLPPFSPIFGHAWLLRNVVGGNDWVTAEKDAPWRRHTTLQLDVADGYGRARVDWWPLLWAKNPALRRVGAPIFALYVALLGVGVVLWRSGLRARARADRTREAGHV